MPDVEVPLAGFPENTLKRVEHNGTKLVVAHCSGQVFAYHDRCPHADWPLSEGTLNNSTLECPGHAWEFDVKSGRCLNAPDHCLTAVPAIIEEGVIRFK